MIIPKKLLSLLSCMILPSVHAADFNPIWEPLTNQLQSFQMIAPVNVLNMNQGRQFASDSPYQLDFLNQNTNNNIHHQRFQIMYQGLPVFGYHMILHHYPDKPTLLTGHLIQNIEADLPSLKTSFSEKQILNLILEKQQLHPTDIRLPNIEKIIYINEQSHKASLAFKVSFVKNTPLSQPNFIINAQTGEILKQWNNLHTLKRGLGSGGNTRSPLGGLTYVSSPAANGQLPPFDVTVNGATCQMANSILQVRDYNQIDTNATNFPITIANEGHGGNPAIYNFACYNNGTNDQINGYADGNVAQSPSNDAMFHAYTTYEMLKNFYGVNQPLGTDLPLRIYTRVLQLDNAISWPTIKNSGLITSHQQLTIGGGNTVFYSMTLGTMAHELCHNVTGNHSDMIYAEQSGGMNEAFSDMCEMAVKSYIRSQLGYTWYWDGTTYHIGQNETQTQTPFRYLNNPALDGNSINNASSYTSTMNVHYSSGVFNRAFYLIASNNNIGPTNAFRYMVEANVNYWVPANTFAYGACGVIQAAVDNNVSNSNRSNIINAFSTVGVNCKLIKPE